MPARGKEHHYAIDAAALLSQCRRRLRPVLDESGSRHQRLAELDVTLHSTERLLHFHLLALVESYEQCNSLRNILEAADGSDDDGEGNHSVTLMDTVRRLEALVERRQMRQSVGNSRRSRSRQQQQQQQLNKVGGHGRYGRQHQTSDRFRREINSHFPLDISAQYAGDTSSSSVSNSGYSAGSFGSHARSPEDSLLFPLIVYLQLCLVRIEEADSVLNASKSIRTNDKSSSTNTGGISDVSKQTKPLCWRRPNAVILGLFAGLGAGLVLSRREGKQSSSNGDYDQQRKILAIAAKVTGSVVTAAYVRHGWRVLGINARLAHSSTALEDWQHQWVLVQSIGNSPTGLAAGAEDGRSSSETRGDSSQLLELIEKQGSKSLVWHSYSALRFLLIKRAMDLLYASVGAAMEMTKSRSTVDGEKKKPSRFWMPIATAAAASYYNIFGPSKKSAEIVSSSSQEFVKNAWGVVSLPAVKHLSLQASRILKGAALADRIEIAGVPCVVLSCAPCPPLATALKRFRRQQEREISHLSTIMEGSDESLNRHSVHIQDYPKLNVILHLTGGGFFAHTLAGDLPYLLDWSRYTEAVVICPEYALLPEHRFPGAIDQISRVYAEIVSGEAGPLLGFRPDRLIVTGEAAGGNLATALCVKSCMNKLLHEESCESIGGDSNGGAPTGEERREASMICSGEDIRLPDALMLSCPMLNMSLELSPSRVRGTNDPVLPSGLIQIISDSYVPPATSDKTDPLASPSYASDDILRLFPPTLICESSEDPLLDDSVDFNTRLKRLGVQSDLKAVHNMPHAFWGLSSAGFPEARRVMAECSSWLQMMFFVETTDV